MSQPVFDARFYVSFGWDDMRKCWVVQARDQKTRRMLLKRDVHTTAALSTLEVKRLMGACVREMESWLPW